MKYRLLLAACLLSLALPSPAALQRYLYVSIPDGAQQRDPVDPGIYIFDIDADHKFVKFIPMPCFTKGLRGFCPNLANRAAYYTDTHGLIGAFDLETEKIVWERRHEFGWDRACISHDGRTIYAPLGWWHRAADGGYCVINPGNGDIRNTVIAGGSPHNSLITQDGQFMLIGGWSWLDMARTDNHKPVWRFTAVGDDGVFPFTVDSANQHAYVCHRKHVGFDVVDLVKGNKLHTIRFGDEPISRRTHGIGLTPDETEVWISDQHANQLIVYDNTVMPPVFKQVIPLSRGGHGWVTFSIDGRFAWCHTPEVIDPKTKQVVAELKTDKGVPVASSKFFEAHFEDGQLVRVGNQFGLGMKTCEPPTLTDIRKANPFAGRIESLLQTTAGKSVPDDVLLFVGSSSFRMWQDVDQSFPEYPTLNRGFGGSQFSDAYLFADSLFDGVKPAAILIYEGDNDIANHRMSPAAVFENAHKLHSLIRKKHPAVPLFFVHAKPCPKRWDLRDEYRDFNRRLDDFAGRTPDTYTIDIWQAMLTPDGALMPDIFLADGVHMNDQGYKIWTRVIREALFSVIPEKPKGNATE